METLVCNLKVSYFIDKEELMEGIAYESQHTSKDQSVCVVTLLMLKDTIT